MGLNLSLAGLGRACILFAAVALGTSGLAPAQTPNTPPEAVAGAREPINTEHEGMFNGQRIRYRAIVSEIPVRDAEGRPGARIVSTSYVAQAPGDRAQRPVLFLFNGGPISASVYLHMGAFGPKRVAFPDDLDADTTRLSLVDNPHTLLDVADLVFFDPAGTGFSRLEPDVAPDAYWSVEADGQQMAAFIRAWLREHGRAGSPVFMFGESYGTLRAAQAARMLVEGPDAVDLDGVVLFGQALNIIEFSQRPKNIISFVVSMPTLSAIAWHHGKVDRAGRTLDQFLDESRAFAADEYLPALYAGNRLPQPQREHIARRLEALTGLPAAYFLANDLRISKEAYRRELFRDRGMILGRNDGRYLGPVGETPGGADPSRVVAEAAQRVWGDYVRNHLRVPWTEEYIFYHGPENGLNGWRWGEGTSPFADWPYMRLLEEAMDKKPDLRVLVGVGIYDTSTTVGASEYALTQSGWPADRSSIAYYGGGHMAYSDEASFRKLMRDVRAFVRPQ